MPLLHVCAHVSRVWGHGQTGVAGSNGALPGLGETWGAVPTCSGHGLPARSQDKARCPGEVLGSEAWRQGVTGAGGGGKAE